MAHYKRAEVELVSRQANILPLFPSSLPTPPTSPTSIARFFLKTNKLPLDRRNKQSQANISSLILPLSLANLTPSERNPSASSNMVKAGTRWCPSTPHPRGSCLT